MLEEPRLWRVGEIVPDDLNGALGDEAGFLEGGFQLVLVDSPGSGARMNLGLPEDFVRHPIADSRKTILQQQHRFDRCAAMLLQKGFESIKCKARRGYAGWQLRPPDWLLKPVMKQDATEEARVAENERIRFLSKHNVIVFERSVGSVLGAQFAGHAEMQAEPAIGAKAKEHLFAVREGLGEDCPGQYFFDQLRVGAAKDAFGGIQLHGKDSLAQTGIPLLAEKFNFGQFRHSKNVLSRGDYGNGGLIETPPLKTGRSRIAESGGSPRLGFDEQSII